MAQEEGGGWIGCPRTDSDEVAILLVEALGGEVGLLRAGGVAQGREPRQLRQERAGEAAQPVEEEAVGEDAAEQARVEAGGDGQGPQQGRGEGEVALQVEGRSACGAGECVGQEQGEGVPVDLKGPHGEMHGDAGHEGREDECWPHLRVFWEVVSPGPFCGEMGEDGVHDRGCVGGHCLGGWL